MIDEWLLWMNKNLTLYNESVLPVPQIVCSYIKDTVITQGHEQLIPMVSQAKLYKVCFLLDLIRSTQNISFLLLDLQEAELSVGVGSSGANNKKKQQE